MSFYKKMTLCYVFFTLVSIPQYSHAKWLSNPFRNGLFGWAWQPEIRVDPKIQKVLDGVQQEVEHLNDILVQMPYTLQQAMLPVLDKASRDMERVFTNSIDQLGDRIEEVSDDIFENLNRTLSRAFIELNTTIDNAFKQANQLIDHTLDRTEAIAYKTLTEADYMAGRHMATLDKISKNRMEELNQGLETLVSSVDGTLSTNIRLLDERLNRLFTRVEDLIPEVFEQSRFTLSELDLMAAYNLKKGSKEMQLVVSKLETSGVKVVAHAIAGSERLLWQLDGIIQEILQEAQSILQETVDSLYTLHENLGKTLEKEVEHAGEKAKETVSWTLSEVARLSCFLVLLLLGYKLGAMAMTGTLTPLPRFQAVALGSVIVACMILLLWQTPLLSLFSSKVQTDVLTPQQHERIESVLQNRLPHYSND